MIYNRLQGNISIIRLLRQEYIFIRNPALKKDTSVRDVLYGFNAPDLFLLLFPLMREFPIGLFLYGKFICIFIIIRGIKILPPFIFV